jgi:hypothetical protein
MPRFAQLLLYVCVVLAAGVAPNASAKPPTLDERINEAIDKGLTQLKYMQMNRGEFPVGKGATAMGAYTMLKCGVSPDSDEIKRALEYIEYKKDERKTYHEAWYLMLLHALGATSDDKRVQDCLAFMEKCRNKDGSWGYQPHEPYDRPDLSNVQFALLGLHAAALMGADIPREWWRDALRWLVASEDTMKRGWGYLPKDQPYGSMTAAAAQSLWIGAHWYFKDDTLTEPDRQLKRAVDRCTDDAWKWLAEHHTVHTNPKSTPFWLYYWHYGLERATGLSGRTKIGDIDWYKESATFIVDHQCKSGGWADTGPDSKGINPGFQNTCFALLCLTRATHPPDKPVEEPRPAQTISKEPLPEPVMAAFAAGKYPARAGVDWRMGETVFAKFAESPDNPQRPYWLKDLEKATGGDFASGVEMARRWRTPRVPAGRSGMIEVLDRQRYAARIVYRLPQDANAGRLFPTVIHLAASDAGGARDGVAFDEFTRERGIWLQILDGEGKPLPPTRWSRDKCDRLLADLGATFPIDPDRVVLWGSGDGATLAWDWATARPDRFAAVVWTGGQIARTELSPNLSGLRVVAMCGDGDPAVPRKPWDAWVKTMQRSGVEVTDRRVPDAGRGPLSEETKHVMRYLHGAQRQPFVSRLSEGEHLIMDIGAWRVGRSAGAAQGCASSGSRRPMGESPGTR